MNSYEERKEKHPMSNLTKMKNTLAVCNLILKPKMWPNRIRLLLAYFKLILKGGCTEKILRHDLNKTNKTKIFGLDIEFYSYKSFENLFVEIFVRQDYYFRATNEKPFIIDCGANLGMTTLFFKCLYPNSKILSFEPQILTFDLLKKNIQNNNFSDVILVNKALSDSVKNVEFFYDPGSPASGSNSMYQERMSGDSETVETALLSKYLTEEVDFLKMDIEGAETAVIKELAEKEKLVMIKEMVIEYHHHMAMEQDNLSKILSILEENSFGYHIFAQVGMPWEKRKFQDLLIYAYRK